MADHVEGVRLAMADELLGPVDDLLADRRATAEQLRHVVERTAEAPRDVRRIARSRGERLGRRGGGLGPTGGAVRLVVGRQGSVATTPA
ncbi:hypothetical protein [Streptomyces sp. WMMC1477]|uniref:hypothetical protein n=1 Tax=unclassified Streptomyces TaxID=2593676 RepID=UPI002FC38ACC